MGHGGRDHGVGVAHACHLGVVALLCRMVDLLDQEGEVLLYHWVYPWLSGCQAHDSVAASPFYQRAAFCHWGYCAGQPLTEPGYPAVTISCLVEVLVCLRGEEAVCHHVVEALACQEVGDHANQGEGVGPGHRTEAAFHICHAL